jgi:hypothetical protein
MLSFMAGEYLDLLVGDRWNSYKLVLLFAVPAWLGGGGWLYWTKQQSEMWTHCRFCLRTIPAAASACSYCGHFVHEPGR